MNDKLTLQELIDLLAARHQMEPQDADAFVKAFWALIEEGLKSDNYVKIKGLGTFKLIDTEARESINIQTGERIEIQSHARVTFSPEASLRDLINRPFAHFETVVLNEGTNFDDLDELDQKSEDVEDDEEDSNVTEQEQLVQEEEGFVDEGQSVQEEPNVDEEQPKVEDEKMPQESCVDLGLSIEEEQPIEAQPVEEPSIEEPLLENEQSHKIETEENGGAEVLSNAPVETSEDIEPVSEEVSVEISMEKNETQHEVTDDSQREADCPKEIISSVDTTSENKVTPSVPKSTIFVSKAMKNPLQELIETPTIVEDTHASQNNLCRKSKRRLSCCIVICALLAGIVLGGFISLYILFGHTDFSENLLSSMSHSEEQHSQQYFVKEATSHKDESVVKEEDTLIVSTESLTQKTGNQPYVQPMVEKEKQETPTHKEAEKLAVKPVTDRESKAETRPTVRETKIQPTSKPASVSTHKSVVESTHKPVGKPVAKGVYLSEKIDYKIVGTIATHTLRPGETLTRVALKYYGNKKIWPYLVIHNKAIITNPDNVPIGTTIKVPKLSPR